jgi:hypothetical protein
LPFSIDFVERTDHRGGRDGMARREGLKLRPAPAETTRAGSRQECFAVATRHRRIVKERTQMKSTSPGLLRPAIFAALLASAAGLWLSGSSITNAASSDATQSVSATVTSAIQWGSTGACTQSMGAAAFGSLAPGSSATAPGAGVFTGCVSSNATWGVTGTMTTAPTNASSTTLAASNFRAEVATVPTLASTPACPVGNSSSACTLDNSAVPLVAAAPATPPIGTLLTNGFTFDYKLSVPSNQEAGTYTGGLITLTASN